MSNKTDLRWREWARGVCEGTTLSQRKWAGKDRTFRRAEYEEGMRLLEAAGVLSFLDKQGYRPRRGRGWEYIQHLARGMAEFPPPLLGTTSPRITSTVRRARTPARSKIRIVSRTNYARIEGKMRQVLVRQTVRRSVFVLYNDRGEAVAKFEERRFISDEEAGAWAEKYRQEHPEEFPGENVQNGNY